MTLTSDTLRGVADMLDALAQLDHDAGRPPLGNDVTYGAGGVALHLTMDDWRPRAETVMGELGGTWGHRNLDMVVCITSGAGNRPRWVDAGTVHVYVPRFLTGAGYPLTDLTGAVYPLTDLTGLPGLVTP